MTEGMLLVYTRENPGMVANTLQYTGEPPTAKNDPKSQVPKNSAPNHKIMYCLQTFCKVNENEQKF